MQRRGRTGWRADSATRWWARIMMPPSRSFPAGAKILARVLVVRCAVHRGAVGTKRDASIARPNK